MKTLKDFDFKNKKVLVRCDFNVPLDEKGKILDDFRVRQTVPTIEYLRERGAKIILMSHLGEPGGKIIESLRLTPIEEKLKEYFGHLITKANDCIGKKIENQISKMRAGEILLLENLRFYKEEKENEESFARKLAQMADLYINDAFGTCHRTHASIVGVPKYLPSGAGLLLEKEIKILSRVLKKPWRPLVTIIGGVKISSKIKVIEKFLEKADHLLLGGEIANAILASKGILINQSMPEPETIKIIEKIDLTRPKLHLPVDVLISLADLETGLKEGYLRESGPGQVKKEEKCYDIGPETIKIFSQIIKEAKMIFWSGPLGMFEKEEFAKGTRKIAQIIARNHQAFKIAGGGDTILALNKFDLFDKFDHISTGGGAMLEFLSGKELPGLKALSRE
jgi:phosphoglycerate kinase